MPPPTKRYELDETDIAIALLKGGLSWEESIAVMRCIKYDKSKWDGRKIISMGKAINNIPKE